MANEHSTEPNDSWSSSNYSTHASFVPKLGSAILDMLNAQPGEHILDFGCGDGVLTEKLYERCGSVVGIDASADMISKAKATSGDRITYYVADGHHLGPWFDTTGQKQFDAVFSSAALHWLKQPEKALQSIHHVLKPNGRLVAEMGGYNNCAAIENALISALDERGFDGKSYSPWFFPSTEVYSELLTANGFKVSHIALVPRVTELDTDIAGWLRTFAFSFLEPLGSEEEKEKVIQQVVQNLQPDHQRTDGTWIANYVRLRVIAIKADH